MSGRSDRIRELYEAALKRPIGERVAFVATHSNGDLDLERRVAALLSGQHDTQIAGHETTDGDSTVLATGTVIGQYRIDGPLGAGGMGVVYRATDTKLHRPAAIKVLPDTLADPEARRRFQREAQMVSSLNHPHVVTVYDAGEYLDRQYLVTEYVDGGTLRQWAARSRGWQPIVELLIGVADAVAVAHEAGILHRDIKPENILLAKNGYAKLADFGLAKLLEAELLADDPIAPLPVGSHSTLAGTVGYMSPEQVEGLPLDGRSDVYSFGLVLREVLSGERASAAKLQQHEAEPVPVPQLPPGAPAELCRIVAKALERDPADRYQTMRELVVDLRRLARHGAAGERPRRIAYLWAAVAALAALSVGAYFLGATRDADRPQAVAVLPFANETGSPDDDYLSEGLGDSLRDRLMELPSFEVQARASSVSFRGQGVDTRVIASTLGVGRLVTGSVRRSGPVLEVLVEVLDGRGFAIGPSLKYRRFEREFQAMQHEIAVDVGALLAPAAQAAETEEAERPTTGSERANALVMSGRQFEHDVKDDITVDTAKLNFVISLYRRATQEDPSSVAAHSRLAWALLYKGDAEAAQKALLTALELGKDLKPAYASAVLSDAHYTRAIYLLRTGSPGVGDAYRQAIGLNPNNADALGAYAQWLMRHFKPVEADHYFKEAIRHDRQSLSRYADYAEFLGLEERMGDLHAVAQQIENRFPDARGYLRLARVYELAGELDVGIAWGLRSLQLQPDAEDTVGQVAELYARIGDFAMADAFEPKPRIGLLYVQRRYRELIANGEEYIFDNPDDARAYNLLAFAHNVEGDFDRARHLLEGNISETDPEADPGTSPDWQSVATLVDALQALPGNESEARRLAESAATVFRRDYQSGSGNSWWNHAFLACVEAQLGRYDTSRNAAAVEALDRLRATRSLAWTPMVLDSLCFKPLAHEPSYQAVVADLSQRQEMFRTRLPATLRAHGVADVRPRARTSATE